MKIDDNPVELEAMEAFRQANRDEGRRLQDQFLKEFHESLKRGEDFCSCKEACKHHGHCMDCITLHRGHGDHLPKCMFPILNKRIEKLSELSEHTVIERIQ